MCTRLRLVRKARCAAKLTGATNLADPAHLRGGLHGIVHRAHAVQQAIAIGTDKQHCYASARFVQARPTGVARPETQAVDRAGYVATGDASFIFFRNHVLLAEGWVA